MLVGWGGKTRNSKGGAEVTYIIHHENQRGALPTDFETLGMYAA